VVHATHPVRARRGTLVGAGAGGYVGNQFGKGSGKTAATAAGVVGGGLLGHALTGN